MKYILVTGGVISGLGKGVTVGSVGMLMKGCGYNVTCIKIDPYLNVDAGTISPMEHGEVFVLDDGGEADLDLGTYERFLDVTLTRDHNLTMGKLMASVLERERRGDYLGKTVQMVPHVTDAVHAWIERVSHIPVGAGEPGAGDCEPNICIIELGGTVGDIESAPFVEALHQFQYRVGKDNMCVLHVSFVPVLGEQKTKPTQQSVAMLRSLGLAPNLLACRCEEPLAPAVRDKLALFCQVPRDHVIQLCNVSNIWRVPSMLVDQGVHACLLRLLELDHTRAPTWHYDISQRWDAVTASAPNTTIAVVGKYTASLDAYLSITKALEHASIALGVNVHVLWVDAEALEAHDETAWWRLRAAGGVLVPGGFGGRGIEGMVMAVHYARTNGIPFLGICLGMQIAVVEFCRNVAGMPAANSTEFDKDTPSPVVCIIDDGATHMGGTMHLGAHPTHLTQGSVVAGLYQKEIIVERHRHRYEVNPDMVDIMKKEGMCFVGSDVDGKRVDVVELAAATHPFFVGVQFHPEFRSRPLNASPLFVGLVKASHMPRCSRTLLSASHELWAVNIDG